MSVLAIIPARAGSKDIPNKNIRTLGGHTLVEWAGYRAREAGIHHRVITTDIWPHPFNLGGSAYMLKNAPDTDFDFSPAISCNRYLLRPPELAQDDTPMIDVVKHVLANVPGPEDQIVVLLQPTQPFRLASHLTCAKTLLEDTHADSVVSVVQLPATHYGQCQMMIVNGCLDHAFDRWDISDLPRRRQDVPRTYIRDGTVYAFRRATVDRYGTIYGRHVLPLIIPPDETCELDTLQDWANVERRWSERA